ncbi:MAG: sulfotransferase [Rubrobacteraceae bacterium]
MTKPKTLLAGLRSRLRLNRELRARVAEKNERLRELRGRLAEKDRELAGLREALGRGAGVESVPVFFIVGKARSGTTWLRGVLNAHPEILCWGEGRFFERSFRREDFEQWRLENIPPSSLYGAMLDAKYLRAWIDRSPWAAGKDTDEHLAGLTRLAINYFLIGQLSKTGAKIVGDKTPFASAEVVEEIGEIYPEARVIHIIRDGRDAAVSTIHHMWNHPSSEGGVYDMEPEELKKRDAYREGSLVPGVESLFTKRRLARIAAGWSDQVGKAMEDGGALSNYAEVRYEDLLESPVEEVGRLLEFLGADAGEDAVEKCVETASFERGASRNRGQEDSTSRFRKGITGDWKGVFTEEDKLVFKKEAGDLLVKLGYERDHDW